MYWSNPLLLYMYVCMYLSAVLSYVKNLHNKKSKFSPSL